MRIFSILKAQSSNFLFVCLQGYIGPVGQEGIAGPTGRPVSFPFLLHTLIIPLTFISNNLFYRCSLSYFAICKE